LDKEDIRKRIYYNRAVSALITEDDLNYDPLDEIDEYQEYYKSAGSISRLQEKVLNNFEMKLIDSKTKE
jgi:hypothetical protein